MFRFLRRVLAFFQRRVDPTEGQCLQLPGLPQDDIELKTVQGVVTSFFGDYGFINESIYFSSDVVTGNVPVMVGQKVNVIVEDNKTSGGLKAIRVDAMPYHFDGAVSSDPGTRFVVGYVTSIRKNIIYVNKTIYFSVDIVSEGFVPYEGDCLEVEYSPQPNTSNFMPHSAKPVNCKHVDQVRITSLHGRNGVIDNTIYFTLDSLKLPYGYIPQKYDIVNAVIVQSMQPCCIWRAISITPGQRSRSGVCDGGGLGQPLSDPQKQNI
uniref:Cancer/testis antigen 55 n=1 Tax=Propithecus coquereli TaxID=379532 RepID=A0A2K6F5B1_PROCO